MTRTPTGSLSNRLRLETEEAHARVERAGIIRRVLAGEIDRAGYVRLLTSLALLYDALETELDRHAAHPVIAPFAFGRLRRLAALRRDIATLGEGAPAAATPPAAAAYARHLHVLGERTPELLVAHAYVRYLGDLSGGQVLRNIVARALGMPGSAGTEFYDYRDAGDPGRLRGRFRDALDRLPPANGDAMVDEALRAFAFHEELFRELDEMR